jgi:hypothetical protein
MLLRLMFDMLLVASIVVWLLPLAASGYLSIEHTAFAILALVICIALGRALGSSLIRLAFRVLLPLASLAVFVVFHGSGDLTEISHILAAMLPLLIVLAGFYVMFGGLTRRGR